MMLRGDFEVCRRPIIDAAANPLTPYTTHSISHPYPAPPLSRFVLADTRPIMFSIFQETPFNTVDLEFIYFFFPYIITATIPTILAVGWKNVNPNRVLTDEQFWLSTCYVQVCSMGDHVQFVLCLVKCGEWFS